jgi:hypothetical protein
MPVSERHRSYAVQIFNKAEKLISSSPAEEIATYRSGDREIHVSDSSGGVVGCG